MSFAVELELAKEELNDMDLGSFEYDNQVLYIEYLNDNL